MVSVKSEEEFCPCLGKSCAHTFDASILENFIKETKHFKEQLYMSVCMGKRAFCDMAVFYK